MLLGPGSLLPTRQFPPLVLPAAGCLNSSSPYLLVPPQFLTEALRFVRVVFQSQASLVAENLFLRKQLTSFPSAPARGEEHCRRREELCVRKLGSHTEAIEPAFSFPTAVATVERQEILVVEMHLDFVKVRLEIDGFAETKVVRLGAGFFRKPHQVGLGIESAERTAPTPCIAGIDRPDINVFFLGAFNCRIQVGVRDTGASAKIVNARRKEEDRFAFSGLGP